MTADGVSDALAKVTALNSCNAGCKGDVACMQVSFLAVQNSSIADLVSCHSLTDSLTHATFTFDIQRATLET